MENQRTNNDACQLFKIILQVVKKFNCQLTVTKFFALQTHHYLQELVIFRISDFADIVEEDGELSEVNCERQFREDSLELECKDLYDDVCEV